MPYCIYLRKSRADVEAEALGQGETLSRHKALLLEVAKKGDYDVTEIYQEIVSGDTIAARPVMQRLLREVCDGLWQGVLVAEIERLARGNTADQAQVQTAFAVSGTRIITPFKVYDPQNEIDNQYFEFGLFMSRQEYRTINRRLRQGMEASAKEGKWVGGSCPYGYERVRVERGKGWTLAPHEPEAGIVKLIFRLYVEGEKKEDGSYQTFGAYSIARRLDSMGVAPPGPSACWWDSTICDILQNPVYIGKIRWRNHHKQKRVVNGEVKVKRVLSSDEERILVDGLHPALIDRGTFDKAQELAQHKGPAPVKKSNVLVNPLAGILVCGECGRTMVLSVQKQGRFLKCLSPVCHNVSSKYETVEQRLLQGLEQWLSGYRLQWDGDPDADEQELLDLKAKNVRKAEANLETLHRQLSRTHDLLEQGVYDTDTFLERSRSLSQRIQEANDTIARLRDELADGERIAASRQSIIPKVEKLLDLYDVLPSAQAKNELLRDILEKVVYMRPSRRGGKDKFELVLYPKLPKSSDG